MNIQANRHKGQRASPPMWPVLSRGDHRTPEFGLEGILNLIQFQPRLHHLLEFTAVAFAGKNDNLGSLHPDLHMLSPGSDRALWGHKFIKHSPKKEQVSPSHDPPSPSSTNSYLYRKRARDDSQWLGLEVVIKILTFTYYKMYIFLTDQRREWLFSFIKDAILLQSTEYRIFFNRYNIQKEL